MPCTEDVVIIENNDVIQYILQEIKNEKERNFEYLGGGIYGTVYGFLNYAIKFFNYDDDGNNDHYYLLKLQQSKYYPKVYAFKPNKYMIVERIEGNILRNTEVTFDYNHLLQAIYDAIHQDLSPQDVSEYNIMINPEGIPIIVDVGDFKEKKIELTDEVRKNLLHFAQSYST